MPTLEQIERIAKVEFSDVVKEIITLDYKLRIILTDDSFIDAYLSRKLVDRFGFHWEIRDQYNTIFRYDNFPDRSWQFVDTFPSHFHDGSQENVKASPFPTEPIEGFRAFMKFVSNRVKKDE